MFSIIHAVEVAYKYSAIYIVDPVSILASSTVPLGCCTCFIIIYLLIVLFNIIGYLFGVRRNKTYNLYTITIDIQITVLGRLFITIYIIWSDNHYFESFF